MASITLEFQLLQSPSVHCIPAPFCPLKLTLSNSDRININRPCKPCDVKMGLLLSVIISYAGVREAIECLNHIISGLLPETEPDFRDYVQYINKLLQRQANPSAALHTTQCGQGYLCLTEDENGFLKSAAIKFYGEVPDSTAILFSTKISSFGQDSVDDTNQANGDCRTERYTPTKTKTIISNTSESFSVGIRDKSPASENISDHRFSANSSERDERDEANSESTEKLTWHYRPKSPVQPTLPEIQFQSYDDDTPGVNIYNEEFLRLIFSCLHASCVVSHPRSVVT